MKGLLIKDFLVLQKALRTYLLFLTIYVLLAIMGVFDISFVAAITQVILLMLPISAFSFDEAAKWDRYAMTLPLGRRNVVASRYLFVVLLVVVACTYNLLACMVVSILSGADSTAMLEGVAAMLASTGLGILTSAIMLPLSYKLGAERARPYLYAVVFLPTIGLVGAAKLGLFNGLDLSWLDQLTPGVLVALFAMLPLVGLVVLGLSYLISCRIVANKEF